MRILLLLSLCFFLLTACSSSIVPPPRSAELLMNEGDTFLSENRYEDAIASWEKVRERFASPEISSLAELKIADAHFRTERYIEAAVAYEAYLKAHPDDQNAHNVLYNLGLSYHKEMLSEERDPTSTRNAYSVFKTFLTRYPTDQRCSDVKKFIILEEDALAGHDLQIGMFYQKRGSNSAAIARLEPLVAEYPNFNRKDELYFFLGSAYLQNDQKVKAAEYFNRLYSEFPKSSYRAKAQKLLEKKF